MKKSLPAFLLALCLAAASLAGCGNGETGGTESTPAASSPSQSTTEGTSAEAPDEVITLKGWGGYTFIDSTGNSSYNDQSAWAEIEKNIGIRVDWTTVTTAQDNEKTQFGLIMASGDLPDFFVDINPLMYEEFGRKGALISLEGLIESDMPSLQGLLQSDPDAKGSITSADGHIYFFPRIMNDVATRCWPGYMIREDWLEQTGLPVPETTGDMHAALLAFKEQIPTATKPYSGDIRPFIWAFGVGSRGPGNNNDDCFIENSEIKFGPTDPRYKDALMYLNAMFSEGLLDPEWDGISGDQLTTNMVTDSAGASFGSFAGALGKYNKLFEADGKGELLVAVPPLKGPDGFRGTQGMHTSIDPSYGGAITSTCSRPEAVARLFDYTYSDEGRNYIYFGIEGDTYTMVDGTPQYTEKVTGSELGVLDYLKSYVANVSCYPSNFSADHYRATLSQRGRQGNEETTKYAGELKVPCIRFSEEEIADVNAILRDINSYVDENISAFVSGQKSFDQWDSYVAGYDKLRLEELMEIYRRAYERFLNATK